LIQKLGILFGLAAALIASIASVVYGDSLYEFSVKVSVSAVVFFVLGTLIKWFLTSGMFKKAETEEGGGENTIPDDDDDE
jgi:hypothetical protein